MEKRYYPYEDFLADTKALIEKIDWKFDSIITVARGGMSLAHLIGEYYDMREVYTINTIGYEDTTKLESVKVFNIPELNEAKSVLIVDDIVDSGDTLVEVLKVLHQMYPTVIFKTASLFYKKSARIAPDWYVREADKWIDFFWSVDLNRKK
jgi:xanthine phosphoribosyltransferase